MIRKAALTLTAGLLLAPAPAFAATSTSSAHHGHLHHSRVVAAHRITTARHELTRLRHTLHRAHLPTRQSRMLSNRFNNNDNLAGLSRALRRAHTPRAVKHVTARINRVRALAPLQAKAVGFVADLDGSLNRWQGVDARLRADDRWCRENEEDPRQMRDIDIALRDLDAAEQELSDVESELLAAAGKGAGALQDAVHVAFHGLGAAGGDLLDAIAALRDLEATMS